MTLPTTTTTTGTGSSSSTPATAATAAAGVGNDSANPTTSITTTTNNHHHPATIARQFSVSEAAEKSGATLTAPVWIRWLEVPFRTVDPVQHVTLPEATGWGMNSAGRGPLNQVGSYVGAAILRLALREVDEQVEAGGADTVYGFKPSSLLTLFTSVIGVCAAIMMPIVGAVVDHTQYRRLLGVLSGVASVVFIGGQIFINQNNWFAMLLIDAAQTLVYLVHTTAVFAYLPDLSLDQEVIAHYTSRFNIRQYLGQFVFVSLVIICGQVRGTDRSIPSTVQTAKDAAGISFGFGALLVGYSWLFLFRDRPALSPVPEGQTLMNTGFKQVYATGNKIVKNYRALRWFMISLLWSPEAGAGVVLSIAVTFLTVTIKLSGQEIAITSLLLMVGNLAGSLFAKKMCVWVNPLNSYRLGLGALGACIALGAVYLNGPRKVVETYATGLVWGVAMGWCYPSQRVLYCTLIPKGQETEMMGLFVFVGQIFGWLPSLIFTIMNENDVPLQYGLTLIGGFCMMAVVCTLPMGNYWDACQQAQADSEDKLAAVVSATKDHRMTAEAVTTTDELVSLEDQEKNKTLAATLAEESAPSVEGEEDGAKSQ